MSNSILPHLLSDSPPPLVADDEEFEDEFGDFKGSEELSFDNENPPTPSSLKNSNEFFPGSYPDFNLCNVEERYQIIETPEDKSTTNIRNSIPPNNYFSLWEQIENNIPEIIDNEEDLQNLKETIDSVENGDEIKNLSTDQSNEHLHNSNCHEEGVDFECKVSSENSKECSTEIIENSTCLESSNSHEQNQNLEEVKQTNEDLPAEIKLVNQIHSDSSIETCSDDFPSTEIGSASVFHNPEIEESKYFNIQECQNESTNFDDFAIAESTNHENYTSVCFEDADTVESSNPDKSNSKNLNVLEELQASQNWNVEIEENQESEDDFGEFADFSSSKISDIPILESKVNSVNIDDEDGFNEFESYPISFVAGVEVDSSKSCKTSQELMKSKHDVNIEETDEFDDFTSYSEHGEASAGECNDFESHTLDKAVKICKTPEEAFKETLNMLEKIFPISEIATPDYSNYEFTMNNSVFENLKDITETNALTYQWSKSAAQKNILKTLNIDIRNILYGPTWNSGMPIFAPNLCSKPLEPIKSELPIPISPQKIMESQESTISATPQFDWSGSGLTDLQDSSLNVEKEFDTNLQTPNEEFEVIQPTYVHCASIPTKLHNFEEELSQSRNLGAISAVKDCQEMHDDFSDFTSYQESTEEETKWKNMLPLRESHISNNVQQDNVETDKISIYFQELTMGKSQSLAVDQLKTNSKMINNENNSRFFEKEQIYTESPFVFDDLQEIKPKTKLEQLVKNDSMENNVYLKTQASSHYDISLNNLSSFKNKDNRQNKESTILDESSTKLQEDEFTDFQSSQPSQLRPSIQPALLEPLKPAILQPEPVKNKSLKIEWPEPGLDEEEINRIVNGVLRKNSSNENLGEKTNNVTPTENNPNTLVQNSDHDDWSDFISVKEPLKSRTSTPDLPLSVFNLGSIQPNKVSAPFIDPNGVVHSPSKTPNIGFPLVNRNVLNGHQNHFHRQPFITSQAFDALYSNTKNNILQPSSSTKPVNIQQNISQFSYDKVSTGTNNLEKNMGLFSQSGRNQQDPHESSSTFSNAEDDDWGDFVSAPNTISSSSSNFFQPLSYMKTNLGFRGKTLTSQKFSAAPKNTVVKQERNSFPVISTMPDLDFVSPKSRSTIK